MSASASRTAVAESTGARTQLTGVVGAAAIVVVLVAASGLGRYLPDVGARPRSSSPPRCALFDLRQPAVAVAGAPLGAAACRWPRSSASPMLGVLEGIVVAIVLSLGNFVRRAWRPYDAVLGRVPGRKGYHDIDRHPEAVQIPGLVLYRFDAPLFFANAEALRRPRRRGVAARDDPIRWVIVAAEPITDIDTTGGRDPRRAARRPRGARASTLAFAELKGPVKDRLRSYDLYDRIGDGRFFPTLGTAIDGYLRAPAAPGPTEANVIPEGAVALQPSCRRGTRLRPGRGQIVR